MEGDVGVRNTRSNRQEAENGHERWSGDEDEIVEVVKDKLLEMGVVQEEEEDEETRKEKYKRY
ncbi:hypothetical protein E2C01_089161 [Portunus trituberculatus]|uniref:Uncharacterized protein n=1 Tax=Portunus trituberculatus TaxID=210409 RepID=A0A5B7J821_PORTR|nr:hypothetical protein [Portunus trituberculatus]